MQGASFFMRRKPLCQLYSSKISAHSSPATAPTPYTKTSTFTPRTASSRPIGASLDRKADKTIDASHMLCYPGLVNTHHHLYQVFSRNLPEVQNMELFPWLKTLYEIWKNLDAEVVRYSSLTGMGELMKTRLHDLLRPPLCLPRRAPAICSAPSSRAAERAGHAHVRLPRQHGPLREGRRPAAGQRGADRRRRFMEDSERADASAGTMTAAWLHAPGRAGPLLAVLRVRATCCGRAPSWPAQLGVRLHTHLCRDEGRGELHPRALRPAPACLYGVVSAGPAPTCGSPTASTSTTTELRVLAETGTGVAHCPISNMKLSSGVCRASPRCCSLASRSVWPSTAPPPTTAPICWRSCASATCSTACTPAAAAPERLRRAEARHARLRLACSGVTDIGCLAVGKCADLFLDRFSAGSSWSARAIDPKNVLGTVGLRGPVDYTVVERPH